METPWSVELMASPFQTTDGAAALAALFVDCERTRQFPIGVDLLL